MGHLGALLRPHAGVLAVGVLAVALEGVANVAEPWPLKLFLDNVVKSKPMPGWFRGLNLPIDSHDKREILSLVAWGVVAIAVVGAACSYTEKYVAVTVGQRTQHDLRQRLYYHIQRLSLDYHDRGRVGDLISRLTSDISAVESFVSSGLLAIPVNVLTLVGMAALMAYVNLAFTLCCLLTASLVFVIVFHYTIKIKKASREVRKSEANIVAMMQEVLSSMRLVKAFASEDYEQKRLAENSLASMQTGLHARTMKAALSPSVDIVVAVGTGFLLWFGGILVLKGSLSAGSLVLFTFYLSKMYKPMRDLSKTVDTYSKAAVAYERIREVLTTDHEVKELNVARAAPAFLGRIEFGNVSFGYHPDRPILSNVNFIVEPGQMAAFVGPTGAGKTTIVNLVARFYDPDAGCVKIDGVDVKEFRHKSLRQQISFVLQENLLFHGSISYNIAYGRPDATRSEILHAAHLANAHEFIELLPQGYDTVIGERGVTISGGQRQRIAIARAIIRNTPILILDEVCGLDAQSEALVFDALKRLMKDRTTIVIAHRLSTMREADVIFVVKNGQIVEQGRHQDLVIRNGLYTRLHQLQSCTGNYSGRNDD
jgi:ATP-binding cassette, subfamily B, bacterial